MAEWKKVLVSGSAADVTSLKLSSVVNASTDTDKFLVLDSSGNVDFRTGTQVRSDIGAGAGSGDIAAVNITAGSGLDGSVNTSTGTHTQTLNLDIDGLTDIGADLASVDLLAVDDGAGGTNRKASMARMAKYMQDNLTFTTNTNTQLSTEQVEDIVDGLIVGGTNVTATYDDTAGTLTLASTDTNTQLSTADVRGKISGTGLISYNSTSGVISTTANNYSLPAATSTVRGGIELISNTAQSTAANAVTTTASRTYGVQVNSAGQGVVNVPWSDTNTNTQLSAAEVREAFSAGSNVEISEGVISSTDTNTQLSTAAVRGKISGTGLISYNSTSGVISTTANNYTISTSDVKGALNADMGGNFTIGNQSNDVATFTGAVTVGGDLIVNGTTTTVNTANLSVEDQFIELHRGATANGDGGIVINGDSINRSFGWDESAKRWAFDFTGATAAQTTIGSDAFAAAIVTGGGSGIEEVNSNYAYSGNIYVNEDSDEIFIYVK